MALKIDTVKVSEDKKEDGMCIGSKRHDKKCPAAGRGAMACVAQGDCPEEET